MKSKYRRKSKTLYHNYLFIFGFLYYLIFPAVIGEHGLLSDYPGMDTFYAYFPNNKQITIYYFLCLMLLISFLGGSSVATHFKKTVITNKDALHVPNVNKLILVAFILLDQYAIFSNAHLLFTGYTEGYHVGILGELATMNCVFLFCFLYNKERNSNSFISKSLALLVLENSFVLLGFGSRMFVLVPFIAYIIYLFDNGYIKVKKLFIFFTLFFILCLIIGAVRGGGSLSIDAMLYIGFAEPLYTWVTAGSYICHNEISWFNYPSNFIGHIINIIPSVIFPNKAQYIPELSSLVYYVSPFGATNLIPKLYGNFGILFTPVISFIGGFLLTVIRYKQSKFCSVLYYCCCGMIPFLLFRDLRSFNKLLIASFCIYPVVLLFLRIKKYSQNEF